jgi:hypothetical protein
VPKARPAQRSGAKVERWVMRVSVMTPLVAQRPKTNQRSAHDAGELEADPQERQVSNLRQSRPSSSRAARVLASSPRDVIALTPVSIRARQ